MPKRDQNESNTLQQALDAVTANGTAAKAAIVLGIPARTVRDRVVRAEAAGLKPSIKPPKDTRVVVETRTVEAPEKLDMDRRLRAAEEAKKEAEQKFKESEKQNDLLQKRCDLLQGVEEGELRDYKIPRYVSKSGQGIFVGVASDLHIEEDVDPGSIPGYDNEYNPEIARARMTKYFQSYVFMLDAWRHVGKCDTAVLAVLGDVISGYIHEELAESNHMSPAKAILFGQELLGAGIEYILKHGNLTNLIVPMTYGNHGRTTVKSRIQTGADNSFEYLMYKTMEREWRGEKRLKFHVAEGYHLNLDLFDHRIRFHHGDAIGYGGGVGGITIPVRKKIQNWNQGSPKPAHLDVFGHFHQLMDGGNFICNGSLIGYNAFALSIGASCERPRQACFWIDAERGKTMFGELYVEVDNLQSAKAA